MAALVATIPAANVANALIQISTIENLVENGNQNLLTASQNIAMQNIQALFQAHSGGFTNYTFLDNVCQDMVTFSAAINNLPNTGPTLTYLQNQAAAGNIVPITSNGFPVNAKTVVFNDTYFICEQPGQGFFAVSNSNDGSQWSPLAYAQAESTPDKLIAVDGLNGEIICFGTATIQFFTDQALPVQPYAQILGSTQQYGLAAVYSRAQFMNSIAFLGQNFQGTAQVFILNGYTPVPISNPDIDNLINSFTYINDAIAFSYVVDGHPMYEITFPIAGYSFLYDGFTQIWSNVQSGVQDGGRHNVQLASTFNYNNFVSDYLSGNIYYFDVHGTTDNGAPVKRELITRHIYDQGNMFGIDQVWLDMDTGEGRQPGQIGADPKIVMRVSKDGGRTYGNQRIARLGKVGQYKGPRVLFRRLGASRDFVLKFTLTDSVPFILNSGSVSIRQGTEGQ